MTAELQPRDHAIFGMTYAVGDGMFPRRLIWPLFWPQANDESSVSRRLRKLKKAEYIWWPTHTQYRDWRIPESVIFLGWRGILDVAEQMGLAVDPPANPKFKKHLNDFAKRLREAGVFWRRKPAGTPKHNLKVIDIRLTFDQSAKETPDYSIARRILESRFRRDTDVVEYSIKKKDGTTEAQKRGIVPDDYILIVDERLKAGGLPYKIHAFLEVDMGNYSAPAISHRKIGAYAAYFGTPQYQARFGSKNGRWFFITTSKARMKNLIRAVKRVAGDRARDFYFSYFELVENENVFTAPIWWQPGVGERLDLDNTA